MSCAARRRRRFVRAFPRGSSHPGRPLSSLERARMDALLAAYDSSDDDERNGGAATSGGRGGGASPAPAGEASARGRDDVDAGATDGSGRVERFPVDGNFATHVYVPLAPRGAGGAERAGWGRPRAHRRARPRPETHRRLREDRRRRDRVSSFVIPTATCTSACRTRSRYARVGTGSPRCRALGVADPAWVARVGPGLDVLVNANRTTTFLACASPTPNLPGDGDTRGSLRCLLRGGRGVDTWPEVSRRPEAARVRGVRAGDVGGARRAIKLVSRGERGATGFSGNHDAVFEGGVQGVGRAGGDGVGARGGRAAPRT